MVSARRAVRFKNIAMVQTTNNVFNTDLYDLVRPQSVLAWQRVRVASLLAPAVPGLA